MDKAFFTDKVQKYKRFWLVYFASLVVVLGLVATINIIIDPYQYFFTNKILGLNLIKPEYEKYLMLSKAAEAKHIKARIVLLGSSRVMSGLSPSNPIFKNSETVYNLGLPGTNMYQSLQYFKHTLYFQKNIERVIIGLDFFMFNEYLANLDNFEETRLGKKLVFRDLLNTSLSIDALQASLTTIDANLNLDRASKLQEPTVKRFRRWLTNFLDFKGFYKTYSLSQQQLDNFKYVIDLCQENNIDYQVFISPTHATQYEAIDLAGLWSTFEDWKRELVKITPIWDFSGYNSITTETISESMKNYIDNSHYSHYTGNLLLNKIFVDETNSIPQDFGVLVNASNLESHLQQIKLDRQQWRENNPLEVELVNNLKTRID